MTEARLTHEIWIPSLYYLYCYFIWNLFHITCQSTLKVEAFTVRLCSAWNGKSMQELFHLLFTFPHSHLANPWHQQRRRDLLPAAVLEQSIAISWQRQQRQLDWESASLGKSHDKGNVILVTENTRKVYAVLEADQIQPPCAWLSVTERDLEAQENGFLVLRKTAGVVISLCELGLPVKCLLVHLLESTSSRECKCRLALSITELVCSEHYEKNEKLSATFPPEDDKMQVGNDRTIIPNYRWVDW